MAEPIVFDRAGNVAESGDRAKYFLVAEIADNAPLDTGELIRISGILALTTAADLAADPDEHDVGVINSASALTWTKLTADNLAAALIARLLPDVIGSNGQIIKVANDAVVWGDETPLSASAVQHIVGQMVAGNTESGIDVRYDAQNQKLNFTVSTQRSLEALQDIIAEMFTGNPTLTYNDGAGTMTLSIPDVTRTASGLMLAADKVKVDSLDPDLQVARGGTARQIYTKIDTTDGNAEWATMAAGGSAPTHLTGTIVSFTKQTNPAPVIIGEPGTASTWTNWTTILTYTAAAAGVHQIQVTLDALLEGQASAGANWDTIVPVGGADRAWLHVEVVNAATGLGASIIYERNGGYRADDNNILATIMVQDELAANDVITFRARLSMQQVGAQGSGGTARVAARVNMMANHQHMRVLNQGEVAAHNTPPPTHQVYIVFNSAANTVPTDTQLQGTTYKSTTGSVAVTDRPATQDTVYPYIWSAEQLTSLTLDNVGLVTPTNQLPDYTESRRTVDGVNGWVYSGDSLFSEVCNDTWRWRT